MSVVFPNSNELWPDSARLFLGVDADRYRVVLPSFFFLRHQNVGRRGFFFVFALFFLVAFRNLRFLFFLPSFLFPARSDFYLTVFFFNFIFLETVHLSPIFARLVVTL